MAKKQKQIPISYKGHESFGAELIEMYSKLGTLRALCSHCYEDTVLPTLARRAQEIVKALTVEMDKQFRKDYPDTYSQKVYYHWS